MEEIIKYLEEIKEHQMGTVQLARSTEVYQLAYKALAKALHIHGVSKSSCEHSHIAWEGNPLKIICQNCGKEVDKKDVC